MDPDYRLDQRARQFLAGKLPEWVVKKHPEWLPEIERLAEKIQDRAKRRSKSWKRTYPARDYHTKPDNNSCTYCYPDAGSVHYTTGRVSRGRLQNPKNNDWQSEWEHEKEQLDGDCLQEGCRCDRIA